MKMQLYCPLCDTYAESFEGHGRPERKNARCPECRALERHRLAWAYLTREADFLNTFAGNVLHVAPKEHLGSKFRSVPGINYLTADIVDGRAMVTMDLTDIQYPAAHFDVIYCSHVLEHIPDDRRAMREMHRVLRPDGVAFIQVPLAKAPTYEDFSITTDAGRFEAFGQEDHVRLYGPDIAERLEESGFNVTIATAASFLSAEEIRKMAIGERSIVVARPAT